MALAASGSRGSMSSASQTLWQTVLGQPQQADCEPLPEPVPCWLCGGVWAGRACPISDWQGANFTGQNKVRSPRSTWICEPCVHISSRIAPVPGRPPKEGKSFGGNFRNYSHCWWRDQTGKVEYLNASKGEKPALLAWLRKPKVGEWWCAIADSGQKHIIPWAPLIKGAKGPVLFDDLVVTLGDWGIVDDMVELLTAGATKEEVEGGDYHPGSILRCRLDILAFEAKWGRMRGGGFFALAIWLAQRDEEKVAARMAAEKEAKKDGKSRGKKTGNDQAARSPESAVSQDPELQPTQTLGAASDPQPSGSTDIRGARGVADIDVSHTADRHTGQLGLWGSLGLAEPPSKPKRRR